MTDNIISLPLARPTLAAAITGAANTEAPAPAPATAPEPATEAAPAKRVVPPEHRIESSLERERARPYTEKLPGGTIAEHH